MIIGGREERKMSRNTYLPDLGMREWAPTHAIETEDRYGLLLVEVMLTDEPAGDGSDARLAYSGRAWGLPHLGGADASYSPSTGWTYQGAPVEGSRVHELHRVRVDVVDAPQRYLATVARRPGEDDAALARRACRLVAGYCRSDYRSLPVVGRLLDPTESVDGLVHLPVEPDGDVEEVVA